MKTTPIQVDSHKGRFLTKDPDELHTLRLAIKRAVDPLPLDQMPRT
jgi:hypothetical protein